MAESSSKPQTCPDSMQSETVAWKRERKQDSVVEMAPKQHPRTQPSGNNAPRLPPRTQALHPDLFIWMFLKPTQANAYISCFTPFFVYQKD